jgi:hypothetical protein
VIVPPFRTTLLCPSGGEGDNSINQLVMLALAEKVSALMTEDCLGERARRGS